jgi:BirA family biotin operon repressor/biotin-[acetyl-CoA-carboxylase] ligase
MPPFASSLPKVPSGYRLLRLETVDSTNAEARRRAEGGEPGPLWIWSLRQSAGRGRYGRQWQSQHGNLFASLLIGLGCSLKTAGQLALLAGVVTYDTAAKLLPDGARSELLLKWPNDVLLKGGKVAGMLIEGVSEAAPNHCKVVIGTGINLASYPPELEQPATSLAAHGGSATPAAAFETLAAVTDAWLSRWAEGVAFQTVGGPGLTGRANGRPCAWPLAKKAEGTYAGLIQGCAQL